MGTDRRTDSVDASAATSPSPLQVALGLFVLLHMAFIVLYNSITLFHDSQSALPEEATAVIDRAWPGYAAGKGHAWKIGEETSQTLRHWAQVTGQDQSWCLFAPNVGKATGFGAIVLIWEEPLADRASAIQAGPELAPADGVTALAEFQLTHALSTPASSHATGIDLLRSGYEPDDPHDFWRLGTVGQYRLRRYESALLLHLVERADETPAEARKRWRRRIKDHLEDYADHVLAYLKWQRSVYEERHPDRPGATQ